MKAELLKKLFEYVSSLEVIAREQIPDIINQVLLKGIILNSTGIILSLLSFVNLYISIVVYKKYFGTIYIAEFICILYVSFSVILSIAGIIGIICCGMDLLTIIYTPKAYLLEVLQ